MNKWLLLGLLVLAIPFANARIFNMEVVTPYTGCSVYGCTYLGDINMNGYIIYNATFVNASIHEFDPVFTAENSSIWNAINNKYDSSNPAGYLNASTLPDNWVNITGDTMTGDLNMSGHNITDVDILFVHNITGRSPIFIGSPVISGNTITADTFYGNIQGTNGTIYGVTITNGSITNLRVSDSAIFNTSLIPELNYTWSLGAPDKLWVDFYVGNIYAQNISSPTLNNITYQIKQPTGPYLAFDNTTFWVNETQLNNTIKNISKNYKSTYTMTCTGANCNVTSAINISYLITQIIVTPPNNNPYRFQLTEYPNTALIIDRDIQQHSGVWDIQKNYAIDGQVNGVISNGVALPYNITIVYVTSIANS